MSVTDDAVTEKLQLSQMSWEDKPPEHSCWGFIAAGGNVTVYVGYSVWKEAVLLHAALRIAMGEYQPWRRFWSPHKSAVEAAENLCAECEDYLCGTLGMTLRDSEDANFDDFLEHLHLRITNGFN